MIHPIAAALALTSALALALPAAAQTAPAATQPAAALPAPNPADVESLDGIMAALYDVISGPAGPRDWDRFNGLFLPGAVMGGAGPARDGVSRLRVGGTADYARNSGAYFMDHAFFEKEVGRKVQEWGPLTQVLSAYETRETADGPVVQSGVNSVTLFHDGRRWWISSITWATSSDERPMPTGW
ncbi:MAG TPA: hypothetical protein VGR32_02830 [Brevundimonas sp.]|jgi:hypothetical protein|uniref:hypothetical protein n=1 Tax=Brevundimonas sp. TaxID=1871086 RepID=UPI002DF542A1|nr:hypothetical protein [Brevundimonas sp.]